MTAAPGAHHTDTTTDESAEDDHAIRRFATLPRDVGWLMVSLGVLGVVLPGLPGVPFLLGGAAVLTPGGPRLLARWAKRRPRGVVHGGLRVVDRWLDDLDRRYPRR